MPKPKKRQSSSSAARGTSSRGASRGAWPLLIGTIIGAVAISLGLILVYNQHHVSSPLKVPPIISPNMVNTSEYQLRLWGTYRSNVYFGIRPRVPQSLVAGLMWFSYNRQDHSLRHTCEHDDRLPRYGWLHHDGVMYGSQEIVDHGFTLTTQYVKGSHDSWTVRISGQPDIQQPQLISLMLYLFDETEGGSIQATTNSKQAVTKVTGEARGIGRYRVTFSETVHKQSVFSHLVTQAPSVSQLTTTVRQSLRQSPAPHEGWPMLATLPGAVDYFPSGGNTVPNLVVYQVTTPIPFTMEMAFETGDYSNLEPHPPLMGEQFTQLLDMHRIRFDHEFDTIFHMRSHNFTDEQVNFAKAAFSNLIGGISYFYGSSKVQSPDFNKPVDYWPTALYTAVPSRSFFPRGFLWDEGFHQIIVAQWNLDITKDVIGHWMDTINWEGWLPREQILGEEAKSKVPEEFVVQRSTNGNPPTFFLTLDHVIRLMKEQDRLDVPYFQRLFPRLQAWYNWFNKTQEGRRPLTYRWKGRNATTDRELNPKTLTSGLDDYPRASHPSNDEYHLDLRCWMATASATMATIADIIGADSKPYKSYHDMLSGNEKLDQLHWDPTNKLYSDYGLHSNAVKLVRLKSNNPQIQGPKVRKVMQKPTKRIMNVRSPRVTHSNVPMVTVDSIAVEGWGAIAPPKYSLFPLSLTYSPQMGPRFVSSHGYVSLFPLMLKIIDPSSDKLGIVLNNLRNPNLLWTPYGLRSLAKTDPLYRKHNTEHDPPYWRGAIWLNMNYLVLSSLHHYSNIKGPHQQLAADIYQELRSNIMENMLWEYKQTGYIWEQYDDDYGGGKGTHPFTGWSSLVVLIMAEIY